jgi:hypothetical protein
MSVLCVLLNRGETSRKSVRRKRSGRRSKAHGGVLAEIRPAEKSHEDTTTGPGRGSKDPSSTDVSATVGGRGAREEEKQQMEEYMRNGE